MSINYYCDLATDASVDEIVSRVQKLMGGTIKTGAKYMQIVNPAVFAQVKPITDPRIREWFLEEWEISSKIRISFGLDQFAPDDQYVAGRRSFSIASVRLGEDLDADAILRFEGDRLMMRRQNGSLTLYDWWPDWTDPKTMAALPPGYILTADGEDAPEDPASGN